MFNLVDLRFGTDVFYVCLRQDDLPWKQQLLPIPHESVMTECRITPSLRWIIVQRHMQQIMFCHCILHWNIALQCAQMRLPAPHRPTQRVSLCLQASGSAAASALSLTPSQQRRVLGLSSISLLLLKMLMRETEQGRRLRGLFRCALHRVSGASTAAHLFDKGMMYVVVTTLAERYSMMVSLSDTVVSVKSKLLRLSCVSSSRSDELSSAMDLRFAGEQLQDHRCFAEYSIVPSDTINMTLVESGMTIVVVTLTGRAFTIHAQPSDSVSMMKFTFWTHSGIPADQQRMIFSGKQLEDDRLLSEHGLQEGSTVHLVLRLRGLGVWVSSHDFERHPSDVAAPSSSSSGAQWIMQPTLPYPTPSTAAVQALVRYVVSKTSSSVSARISTFGLPFSCASEEACVALQQRVDHAHSRAFAPSPPTMHAPEPWAACSELGWNLVNSSCENDFRMLLTLQELRAIAGHETCMRILSALETETPDAIVLRRTVASGRWIDFHTDTVARTVQVRSVSRSRRMFPC